MTSIAVFAAFGQLQADALVIGNGLFINRPAQIAAPPPRAVPTIFQFREFAAAGGLMNYGGQPYAVFSAAVHVDRCQRAATR